MTIADYLIRRAKRTPFHHLPGYMERYWLVPFTPDKPGHEPVDEARGVMFVKPWRRPLAWLLQKMKIAVRVHHILRSDEDRALHDHPWNFTTIILKGGYWEVRPVWDGDGEVYEHRIWHPPGSILRRKATDLHRLELPQGQTAWTLFITGPWRQVWGFVPDLSTGKKVPYREYLGLGEQNGN